MRRVAGIALFIHWAVWFPPSEPAAAFSPSAKVFVVAGAPPMETIAVEPLVPTRGQGRRFAGAATLHLSGASALPLGARVARKRRKDAGLYRFRSTASGFPRFKGTILPGGTPSR